MSLLASAGFSSTGGSSISSAAGSSAAGFSPSGGPPNGSSVSLSASAGFLPTGGSSISSAAGSLTGGSPNGSSVSPAGVVGLPGCGPSDSSANTFVSSGGVVAGVGVSSPAGIPAGRRCRNTFGSAVVCSPYRRLEASRSVLIATTLARTRYCSRRNRSGPCTLSSERETERPPQPAASLEAPSAKSACASSKRPSLMAAKPRK